MGIGIAAPRRRGPGWFGSPSSDHARKGEHVARDDVGQAADVGELGAGHALKRVKRVVTDESDLVRPFGAIKPFAASAIPAPRRPSGAGPEVPSTGVSSLASPGRPNNLPGRLGRVSFPALPRSARQSVRARAVPPAATVSPRRTDVRCL